MQGRVGMLGALGGAWGGGDKEVNRRRLTSNHTFLKTSLMFWFRYRWGDCIIYHSNWAGLGSGRRQQVETKQSRVNGYPDHRNYGNLLAAMPLQLGIRSFEYLRPFKEEIPWTCGFKDGILMTSAWTRVWTEREQNKRERERERESMSAKSLVHSL